MSALTLSSVLQHVPGAEASRFGAEVVVLDPSGRTLRGLSPTAARIWELIDGARTLEQIADALAAEYGQPSATVREDVLAFVRLLLQKGLLAPLP